MEQTKEKQLIDREQEIIFTNFTDEDFDGRWNESINHKKWPLRAGKSYYLPFYLAEHFAKHLVDRELNKRKLPTNHFSRQELLDKCVTIPENPDLSRVQMKEVPVREVKLAAEERRESYVSQGRVAPSDIPTRAHLPPSPRQATEKIDDESFEGLKDNE